jgi:hypothetical protein
MVTILSAPQAHGCGVPGDPADDTVEHLVDMAALDAGVRQLRTRI